MLYTKSGVQFTKIAAGGFRILSALEQASLELEIDLVITSACDGAHSGPDDPHHRGEAYDVRSHDLVSQVKEKVLSAVMKILGFELFYGFLESPDTDNEHFHFQVAKGKEYPDPLAMSSGSGAGGGS